MRLMMGIVVDREKGVSIAWEGRGAAPLALCMDGRRHQLTVLMGDGRQETIGRAGCPEIRRALHKAARVRLIQPGRDTDLPFFVLMQGDVPANPPYKTEATPH